MARLAPTVLGLLVLLASVLPALAAAPMQQAFLVQNSGWMEPFYADPASPFKALVARVVRAAADPGDPVHISAFNQDTPENPSPRPLHRGRGPGEPERVLRDLGVATKDRRSGALADTDFRQAVTATITGPFGSAPGIVWIFTNNRNSPGNDPRTALRNEEFYRLLHLDPSITRTLAFPLRMPVRGRHYEASALMVYALAYGQPASAHLAALVESKRLEGVFPGPPARLKPIDSESVRLVPRGVPGTGDVSISLAADRRTLLVDVRASDVLPVVEIGAAFENLFHPYVIASARPAASLRGAWGESPVPIRPERVEQVAPGERRDVSVRLPVPLAHVPGPLSPAAFRAMGKPVAIPAVLQVSLAEQRLALSEPFRRTLEELFPDDPLLRVFQPPQGAGRSSVAIPMVVRIQHSLWPLVAVIVGGFAVLGGALALAVLAGRPARYGVVVDGTKRALMVPAFGTAQVRAADGAVAGSLKRRIGRPVVAEVTEGHTLVLADERTARKK